LADFDFARLRRWPDVEADNLFAYDATDRLILDLAAPLLPGSNLAIIGDNYGALTVGAGVPSRVHQDALLGELALRANAEGASYTNHELGRELLDGATLVLMQLPRSLAELEQQLDAIARYADPSVVVIAGGRIKHLTPAINSLMLRFFAELDVSLAQQKSRAFTLRSPLPVGEPEYPKTEAHGGLTVAAHGGVFAGTTIDIGTRLLLTTLPKITIDAGTAIDLGCGSGVLAVSIARLKPTMRVIASDQSAAAVASARLTAELNGVGDRVEVVRDDGLQLQSDGSADLVLLNPPFHSGATVHTGLALRMFDEAARVLRPGGQLWTVFNTHLGYRQALARSVGPTELVTHNAKFTVTVSTRA
jgi:16S rRNA (guanine1207-N2)-methyltransferase